MNLKILSAVFLMGVSGTPLLAQPTPPVPLRCTDPSDTLCNNAAVVYNAIIPPNPLPATTTLAGDVANLQSFIENPNMSGTSVQTANSLIHKTCFSSSPPVQACIDLQYWVTNLYSTLRFQQLPPSTIMNNLVATQGNMSQLNYYSPQFYNLFYAINQLDIAISAFPSTPGPSKVNKSLPAPSAPAAPAKGTAPTKK